MKKSIITFIALLVFSSSFSQPSFSYNYKTSPAASLTCTNPINVKCQDGNFIGIGWCGITGFLIYKTDTYGNMLWQNLVSFPAITSIVHLKITLLSDSSVAILFLPFGSTLNFVVVKVALNGTIAWAKGYDTSTTNAVNLKASSSGGMVMTGLHGVFFLNSSGSVDTSYQYNSLHCLDIVSNSTNSFTAWGYTGVVPNADFFLCNIDSNGIVSDYFNYSMAGESATSNGSLPHTLIAKSLSGGYYCTNSLQVSAGFTKKTAVFYFNAQHQKIWAKKIETDSSFVPLSITSSSDNGCIVAASYSPTSTSLLPMVLKFDSTGTVEWIKTPGNISNSMWTGLDIRTAIQDSGTGWFCTVNKGYLHIIHTDSAFNGFCDYSTYTPVITDLIVTTTGDTDISVPVSVSEMNLTVDVTPKNIFRYDACTGILIDSVTVFTETFLSNNNFQIFPNPTNDFITIRYNLFSQKQITLSLFNLYGQPLTSEWGLLGKSGQEIKIDMRNFPAGIYFVKMNVDPDKYGTDGKEEVRKVVKY